MGLILSISPHGRLATKAATPEETSLDEVISGRVAQAFSVGQAQGLLHLATRELQSGLPPQFAYARDFASRYLTRLCHTPDISNASELAPVPTPAPQDLAAYLDLPDMTSGGTLTEATEEALERASRVGIPDDEEDE